ncbi:MAG: hypothetical protein Q9180_003221 [Flavoplaca navasiana]
MLAKQHEEEIYQLRETRTKNVDDIRELQTRVHTQKQSYEQQIKQIRTKSLHILHFNNNNPNKHSICLHPHLHCLKLAPASAQQYKKRSFLESCVENTPHAAPTTSPPTTPNLAPKSTQSIENISPTPPLAPSTPIFH